MIRSVEEFVSLRTSSNPDDYRRAAGEEAPVGVWNELIKECPDMRFWVAHNKTVPLEILRVLATDADPRVRTMVASKRKLDEATFGLLASDPNEGVRMAVARNRRVPLSVLRSMRGDPWSEVARVVDERLSDTGSSSPA